MRSDKRLTFLEAAAIITGYGVGGGIMTLPLLATKTGLPSLFLLLGAGFFVSWLMHLMVAEVILRDGGRRQMVELFQRYIFAGRPAALTWVVFALITFAFLASLAAYVAGGGRILAELFGLPAILGQAVFYAIAAGVVFFGLKALGVGEKYGVLVLLAIVAVFAAGCFTVPFSFAWEVQGAPGDHLKLFGMVMFSFFAIFSVPQVAVGLDWNRKLIPRAITLGIALNALVITAIVVMTTGVAETVDEVAIISLGQALGPWAALAGSIFIVFAMLTSYWSVSFALATVVAERVRTPPRVAWLLATLPSFALVLGLTRGFLGFMELAGGAIALLVALMVIPLFRAARVKGENPAPEFRLRALGTTGFQALVILGYLAMALGALLP